MAVHTAYTKVVQVNALGAIVPKSGTIAANMGPTENKVIVLYDATHAPNATGLQTIEEYLVVEEAASFHLRFMNQTVIHTSTTA